jgi:hypothetical protein
MVFLGFRRIKFCYSSLANPRGAASRTVQSGLRERGGGYERPAAGTG